MVKSFEPDYRHVVDAACNREAKRLPLYEHNVSYHTIGQVIGKDMDALYQGDSRDLDEFFAGYCDFFLKHGYDVVTFEQCIGAAMPGAGSLLNSAHPPAIQSVEDFNDYPWEQLPELYFKMSGRYFEALSRQLPPGMRAIGGVGNGLFECVQDLTGFENLCYLAEDEPELYEQLFERVAQVSYLIWQQFMERYGDLYCVLRFGDDLGYKSATLLSTNQIKRLIIPRYRPIVELVHQYKKPFLLHSCGCIFDVMEDLIMVAGIDAKHSNEDQICKFPYWVKQYGDRIGNFGGIDTDAVCRLDRHQLREYISDVINQSKGHGGFAFGTGNSIPSYVPVENYLAMIEIVRELRTE